MTFPKASEKNIKLEKPPFLRGLRWKITVAFVLLFFCLWFVLGVAAATIEYYFLRQSFEQSATGNGDYLRGWETLEIENLLAVDYKNLQKNSSELIPWLNSQTKNTEAVELWLKRYDEKLKLRRKSAFDVSYNFNQTELEEFSTAADNQNKSPFQFIVFDENKGFLAASGSNGNFEYAKEKEFIRRILDENLAFKKEIDRENGLHLKLAFPLFDEQKNLKGYLFFKDTLPFGWSEVLRNGSYGINEQLFSNLIFFSILGFIFGSPFAWYLSKRLEKIASAAQSWRTGDFSAKTNDKSSDEVGILSRHLNKMADDLRENFALRQTIATAEERNRIARDLHDSVKQQVFGLAMQISTASALVEKNPDSAKNYLHESENLIKEIQAELVDMIREFSLPVKELETFRAKIESLAKDWARQNVLKMEIIIDENIIVSPNIAQTFYRITQETLSNIARHSEATEVKITLKNINKNVQMSISDNGCGFDTAKIKKGFGLQSIRERAESLPKGWLKIDSKINVGTTVEVGCEVEK